MNRRMVFYTMGRIVQLEALLLLIPFIVSLYYKEACWWTFPVSSGIAMAVGTLMRLIFKPSNRLIYAKEGFVTVAFAWILLSLIGALPFYLSGEIPSYIDAVFETVSGFTTTGASIVTDVERMSRGPLFWRSFTHWVGGMGVLVFIMAIVPSNSDRSIHIMRAEMPGPVVGKLVPKIEDTAKILYLIYIIMTAVEMILLICGGMPPFESALHAFGTAGTGGLGLKADSIAGYNHYLQWVIAVFMFLFGINFNLYYLAIIKRFKSVLRSSEMWCFTAICVIAAGIIAVNIYPMYENVSDCIRLACFHVASLASSTGYSTIDYNVWPQLSKTIMVTLMIIGGCAGSTAGGFKLSRVMILFKAIKAELRHMLHPKSVSSVKFEGKSVEKETVNSVLSYLAIFVLCFACVFIALCFEDFDFETNFTATLACINNIGPGFGAVGPASSFAAYSPVSKIILSGAMLLGRLEIYPIIFAFSPSSWTKR